MAASVAAGASGSKTAVRVLTPFVLLASVWLVLESTGVHEKMLQFGAKTVDRGVRQTPPASQNLRRLRGGYYKGAAEKGQESWWGTFGGRVLTQIIYGAIYYCLVVTQYPDVSSGDNVSKGRDIQEKNECEAMCAASTPNKVLAWLCTGPRAAHTFHSVGVLNYWVGLLFMSICPCLTLCWANAFTDLNEKLGGQKRICCMACICTMCCSCCVVAQDAQALDDITDVYVGCFGVTKDGASE